MSEDLRKKTETSPELEPTKTDNPKLKFNWVAFFVMIIALAVAWVMGLIIPGPLDDFAYQIVIVSVYSFLNAHGFNVKNIFKK